MSCLLACLTRITELLISLAMVGNSQAAINVHNAKAIAYA